MAAVASSIGADRDHSMVVATTIRTTTAITEIIGRIMGSLHAIKQPSQSQVSQGIRAKKGGWSLFHAAQMRRTKFARWARQMRPTPAPVPGCRERQRLRQQ